MIFTRLRTYYWEKKIKQTVRTKQNLGIESSGKACFIIDSENLGDGSVVTDLCNDLRLNNSEIEVVICGSEFEIPKNFKYQVLETAEVSWNGEFKNEALNKLLSDKYEYLICNLNEKNLTGFLLASLCKAGIKIGSLPDPFGIYDVEIRAIEQQVFRQETIKYLKILKKI